MPRFNITMSEELWEKVGEAAPAGNRSFFIREALEAALGTEHRREGGSSPAPGLSAVRSASPAPPRAPAFKRLLESTEPGESPLPKVAQRHWAK